MKKKSAPKLPRFRVPKDMTSKVYVNKKQRSRSRMALKKLIQD